MWYYRIFRIAFAAAGGLLVAARGSDAGVAGDEAARASFDSDEDPFDDVDRRALEYGLTVCASEDA